MAAKKVYILFVNERTDEEHYLFYECSDDSSESFNRFESHVLDSLNELAPVGTFISFGEKIDINNESKVVGIGKRQVYEKVIRASKSEPLASSSEDGAG